MNEYADRRSQIGFFIFVQRNGMAKNGIVVCVVQFKNKIFEIPKMFGGFFLMRRNTNEYLY